VVSSASARTAAPLAVALAAAATWTLVRRLRTG
jgi:hypothetical protein